MSIEQTGSVSCYLPCDTPSVAIGIVCNHHFCWDHFREHRQTYEKYLDDADNKQQPLSNCLVAYKNIESKLRSTIDHWESQAIDDIHRSAENARKTLANHIEYCRSHFEEESSTITESCVGNYWAMGASDEYLLAQEFENKQLTLFDRHGRRGISMIWHHDVVIRDIQWYHDLRQFFILLDKKLILFDPVTRLFQEITRIAPYQTNSFRRCTCRNDRLFISYWCQESAVEWIQISSWTLPKRRLSPVTCRANEFITCIQLNSNDQLAFSIQDENNPLNRQCRFELRDLDLNTLRTISLDTVSGVFSRMTSLPDGYWALLNVDNNLVFLLDEQCVVIDKIDPLHGPLRNIALI
ncbi:unnamed protein product, partial [Rotaria socialis]